MAYVKALSPGNVFKIITDSYLSVMYTDVFQPVGRDGNEEMVYDQCYTKRM
jgi:hypothetical protein